MSLHWVKEKEFPLWYRLNLARPSNLVGRVLSCCLGSSGDPDKLEGTSLRSLSPNSGSKILLADFFRSIGENKAIRYWQYCKGAYDFQENHWEWLQAESHDDKDRVVLYTAFGQHWYNPAWGISFFVSHDINEGYFDFEELRLPGKKPIRDKHYAIVPAR